MLRHLENPNKGIDSHEKLWDRFLKGDKYAYEKLFKAYYRDLYGYGLKLAGKPELVKDKIQQLFVNLWERREGLSQVSSIKGYLLISLRRMIFRELKKNSRMSLFEEDEEANIGDLQFSAEEILINKEIEHEQKQELLNALKMLPDRQREVLFLRYFNGMSYEEIQDILSINYQSVRNHVYRATKRLKEILEDKLYKIVI